MAALNSFPPGAIPEYRLNCRQQTNRAWRCSPVEEQWVGFVELGVVCNNEDITNMQETTQLPTTSFTDNFTTCTASSSVLATTLSLAVITVFVVLQAATMIALISTCVVFKRKLKQK